MKPVLNAFIWLFITVAGAHLLAYGVVQVLPSRAVAVLGFQSAQVQAREGLERAAPLRSYDRVVADLARGELGTTLDGTPVADELATGIEASVPRLAGAALLVAAIVLVVALLPLAMLRPVSRVSAFLAFFPPFVAPFLMLWVAIVLSRAIPSAGLDLMPWLAGLAVALPALAFASAQAAAITERNLGMPFAVTIRAVGATPFRLRVRLLHHLLLEMAPTLEKLAIGLVTALLFAESVFGMSGLGSLTLRAIRRTDVDLILALVMMSAFLVASLRIATAALRAAYGVTAR